MTFTPSTRRIYDRSVRVAIGLRVPTPPRPPSDRLLCDSCSSGQSFAFSFLPAAPHRTTLAVQLGVPSHRGPQGTFTPKSLPEWLSPHGYSPAITAGRAMPGARRVARAVARPSPLRSEQGDFHHSAPPLKQSHSARGPFCGPPSGQNAYPSDKRVVEPFKASSDGGTVTSRPGRIAL